MNAREYAWPLRQLHRCKLRRSRWRFDSTPSLNLHDEGEPDRTSVVSHRYALLSCALCRRQSDLRARTRVRDRRGSYARSVVSRQRMRWVSDATEPPFTVFRRNVSRLSEETSARTQRGSRGHSEGRAAGAKGCRPRATLRLARQRPPEDWDERQAWLMPLSAEHYARPRAPTVSRIRDAEAYSLAISFRSLPGNTRGEPSGSPVTDSCLE